LFDLLAIQRLADTYKDREGLMNQILILSITLLLTQRAAADGTDETHETETEDDPSPVPLPDFDVLRPRQGLHIGFSAGGAYIPAVSASAAMVSLDFNIGQLRLDHRISPILYFSSQSDQLTMGGGLALRDSVHFNSRYTISAGGLISVHHAEFNDGGSYTTLGLGVIGSPATVRFGTKRNMELSLNLLLLREFEYNSVNLGAFLAFSFLNL
jgi:hypothetical protein